MAPPIRRADVAIVGAGTAGAATALSCARRGLDVVCLERRSLDEAGAHWINGVTLSAFERAGIAAPSSPELLAEGVDFHVIAGWGPERVIIRDHELMEVDMRRLVARLQASAAEAGAEFIDRTHVDGIADDGTLQTSRGPLEARWCVDASGLSGARLLSHAKPAAGDLCAAAQQVRRICDVGAARRFCLERGAAPGHTLCFSGVEGGYSILSVRVDDDHVSLLTGTIPARGHRSGRALLEDFVREQPWIGEPISAGARAIPIRPPYRRLHRGRVAVVGDAACQVFSAHGSGIGAGMIAGRLLAEALADGRGLGGYTTDWHRTYGGLFAGYALFRKFSQALDVGDLERLMTTGLLDADLAAHGVLQQTPRLALNLVLDRLAAARRAPDLAARLAPVLLGMAGASVAYAAFPATAPLLDAFFDASERLLESVGQRLAGSP